MAKTANERDAMILNKVAVAGMVLMALPCALQAVNEIGKLLYGKQEKKWADRERDRDHERGERGR